MGGTLRGKIDFYINTASRYTNAQNFFKNIYDFCVAHPNMTQIARNGGSGGGAANVDYHDGTNPFLNNAWFVFRMNDATLESGAANPTGYSGPRTFPWYLYCQWNRYDLANISVSPAAPSAFDASTVNYACGSIALSFAIPVGSVAGTSEVAWNGTGSLGTGAKGTPVWRTTAGTPVGFSGSYVFPRSNNPGGTHNTSRENCTSLMVSNVDSPVRGHIIADDDSIILVCDQDDDGTPTVLYFGLYTVRSGITINYPMVHMGMTVPFSTANTVYGTTSGAAPNGGFPWNTVATDSVRGMISGRFDEFHTQFAAPNNMFATEQYDEWNIPVMSFENPSYYGFAGHIDFMKEAYDLSMNDGITARSKIALGTSTSIGTKLLIPWDGVTVPRSNFTRAGITF